MTEFRLSRKTCDKIIPKSFGMKTGIPVLGCAVLLNTGFFKSVRYSLPLFVLSLQV